MAERQALTVRFPSALLGLAKGVRNDGESLNDVIVKAVDREIRRRRGLHALDEIDRIREQVKQESGIQPDSTPMIRELREGIGRRE